jgi:hypothetical protein
MRFRKSIKIAPGIKVNVSKSGLSTTVGKRGLSVNAGSKGVYLNTGIPGTGVSSRTKLDTDSLDSELSESGVVPIGKTGGRVLVIISIIMFIIALVLLITGHPVWAFLSVSFGGGIFICMILGRMAAGEEEGTDNK